MTSADAGERVGTVSEIQALLGALNETCRDMRALMDELRQSRAADAVVPAARARSVGNRLGVSVAARNKRPLHPFQKSKAAAKPAAIKKQQPAPAKHSAGSQKKQKSVIPAATSHDKKGKPAKQQSATRKKK